MARDWSVVGRFAPPMAQAAMQGASLADPSNPEGNKLALRAIALGLGALTMNPLAAASMYGVAEGGARYLDTGSVRKGIATGFEDAVISYAGGKVLSRVIPFDVRAAASRAYDHISRGVFAARQATGFVAGDAAYLVQSNLATPTKILERLLFSQRSGGSPLPAIGTAARTVTDAAIDAGLIASYGELVKEKSDQLIQYNAKRSKESRAGAPEGAGRKYVDSQTNSVSAVVSQDAKVNRHLIRQAFRDFDATGDKEALSVALRPILSDAVALAAVKDLNSADYYSKTHRGQPISRLVSGIGSIDDETTKARLQKTLDDHNAAFSALSEREQLTGGK